MKTAHIQFRFLSPWHVSSGSGGGPAVDATILRSAEGLPLLPGRAVKGLCRDAVGLAEATGDVATGETRRLFGTDLMEQDDDAKSSSIAARYRTDPGALRFGSAMLPETWRRAAKTDPHWAAEFVQVVAATAMQGGVAKENSLRTFEVAVPMTLTAEVEGPDDEQWLHVLRTATPFLRGVGAHRHRGFGRVVVSVEEISL